MIDCFYTDSSVFNFYVNGDGWDQS